MLLVAGLAGLPAWADDSETAEQQKKKVKEEYQRSELQEYVEVNVSYIPTSDTIATKLPVPVQETPFNVGLVSGALFREQNAQVLGDTLLNVSGVNVQSQSGIADYVVIRGFDSLSSALVMTDGAPEPEVTYYSTYNVEGVEVLKGPGGFLYGAYPLAGTVNMVRKQPIPTNFLAVTGMAGSFDTYEGTLDWNTTSGSGDVSFRLNGIWRESDGYRADKPSSQLAINPGLAWKIGTDTTLNFNLEYVDSEYTPDAGLPLYNGAIPDVNRETNYQTPADFSEQEIRRFQIDYETKLSDNVTLRDKFYYRSLDWQSNGTILRDVFDPGIGPLVVRSMSILDSDQEWYGNQLEAVLDTSTGSVRHQLLFGLELSELTDGSVSTIPRSRSPASRPRSRSRPAPRPVASSRPTPSIR
jgi:outer membrane receptor for monomeric catechols